MGQVINPAVNGGPPGTIQLPGSSTGKFLEDNGTFQTVPASVVTAVTSANGLSLSGGTLSFSGAAYSPVAGSSSIATVGTVTVGTWNATAITDTYIASSATWNAKQNAITTGTSAQYIRGDLTLGTSNAASVGLGSVTNNAQVISVSVATVNGVSGSSSGGQTPSITITLGAITPTTVNGITFSGSSTPTLAVTGTSSISGLNTGDQNLAPYAPLASPAFTGTPTAPTATSGTNTTQLATTAFVQGTAPKIVVIASSLLWAQHNLEGF